MKKILYGCILSAILANSSFVFADNTDSTPAPSVVGNWKITFYLEPTRATGATQCLVLKSAPGTVNGVATSGTWTSPTFPGWSGQWIQLGDHVRILGVTGTLATQASGNVENRTNFGGVSFNHFAKTNAASSSSGSWTAVRVASCSGIETTYDKGKDPATNQ